jgi:5'-deoxynucleotidase YfbR-like HD superfamily hydrolase
MNYDYKRATEIYNPRSERCGSGYLLQDDLILTAFHVVSCTEESGGSSLYDIRFLGESDSDNDNFGWHDNGASLYWYNTDHDLALLKITGFKPSFLGETKQNLKFGQLESKALPACGCGFPVAQKIENRQNPYLVDDNGNGKLSRLAGLGEKQLQLHIEGLIPNSVEEWQGMSGTALFVNDCLVGVIVEAKGRFKQKVLWVTSILLVLKKDKTFLQCFHNSSDIPLISIINENITREETMGWTKTPKFAESLKINSPQELQQLSDFAKLTTFDQEKNSIEIRDFISKIPERSIYPDQPLLSVILRGSQGAGKTTFLSGLYALLNSNYSPRAQQLMPLYINLNDYINRNNRAINRDIRCIGTITEESSENHVILMVDGLTARANNLSEDLTTRILQNINFGHVDAIIWSVSDEFERKIKEILSKNDVIKYSQKELFIKSIENNDRIDNFLELFITLHNKIYSKVIDNNILAERVDSLKNLLDKLDVSEIDQFLLSILYQKMEDGNEIPSLSWCLEKFCLDEFNFSDKQKESLKPIAFFSYKVVIQSFYYDPPSGLPDSLLFNRQDIQEQHWSFVTENNVVRDFLAMWYVISLISDAGADKNKKLNDEMQKIVEDNVIGYDFPRAMNKYARELIAAQPNKGKNFYRGIEKILDYIIPQKKELGQTMNILCYFLGRCSNQERSKASLKKVLDLVDEKLEELPQEQRNVSSENKQKIIENSIRTKTQYRTISVSCMKLFPDTFESFLLALFSDKELASIGRGYHLIYYGDSQPYKDKVPNCYLDSFDSDWSNSFFALKKRIIEKFDNLGEDFQNFSQDDNEEIGDDKRVEISFELQHHIFTLASFVQSRLGYPSSKNLSSEQRDFTKTVISFVLKYGKLQESRQSGHLKDQFTQYLKTLQIDMECNYTKWDFVIDLYRFKWEPRRGWLNRAIQDNFEYGRIESVADHTLLAVYLAHFLLPKSLIGENEYDKVKIKEILIFHDILEVYTGDFISYYMNDQQKKLANEISMEALGYIRSKDTYSGLHETDLINSHQLEWEHNPSPSVNVRIAKDFDKLENLIQLHIYRKLYPKAMSEDIFCKFEKNLLENIQHEIVKQLSKEFVTISDRLLENDKIKKYSELFRNNSLLECEDKISYP